MSDGSGNFEMLLGGWSTGKSFILRKLVEERNREHKGSALLISGRLTGSNLVDGIFETLRPSQQWRLYTQAKCIASPNGVLSETPTVVDFICAFVAMHKTDEVTPCIVVDSANLVFHDKDEASRQQSEAVLQIFTKLTKQDKRLNVLLAYNDTAQPSSQQYRLQKLGLHPYDISRVIFASEPPPAKMLDKLRSLGVGDQLAGLLVGIYGGHIWTLYLAARAMCTEPDFMPLKALPVELTREVIRCIKAEQANESGMKGMREMLQQLAETGFVPLLTDLDPRATRLSAELLADVVNACATTAGIPEGLWGDEVFGLVPASQYTRLLIARALNRLDSPRV